MDQTSRSLKRLEPEDDRPAFSWGDDGLDEFYYEDSRKGGRELTSVTYVIMHDDAAVAFFSVSNGSIKKEDLPGTALERIVRKLPHEKRYRARNDTGACLPPR